MERFPPFKGTTYAIRKLGEKGPQIELLAEIAGKCLINGGTADCIQGLLEMVHYNLSHRVINVTKNLGERLLSTKIELELDNLFVPHHIFEICWENGLKIPGTDFQLPGCLVILRPDDATFATVEQMAKKAEPHYGGKIMLFELLKDMFSVKYHDPHDESITGAVVHCNVPSSMTKGLTVDQLIDNLPEIHSFKDMDPTFRVTLDDRDKMIQKWVVTAVLTTLSYLNTSNPDVQPFKFKDRPRVGSIPPNATIVGSNFTRCPPGWHLRRPHMRWLRDERFKRDEQGRVRAIWIHAAEINKNANPAGQAPKTDEVIPNE